MEGHKERRHQKRNFYATLVRDKIDFTSTLMLFNFNFEHELPAEAENRFNVDWNEFHNLSPSDF